MLKIPILYLAMLFLAFSVTARELKQVTSSATAVSSEPGTKTTATATASGSIGTTFTVEEEEEVLLDVYFLIDLTETKENTISLIKEQANATISGIVELANDTQLGVGTYSNDETSFRFTNLQNMTDDIAEVVATIESLNFTKAVGDEDSQLFALEQIAIDPEIGFRDGSIRILIWIGDAPGKDPIADSNIDTVIDALSFEGEIYTFAIDLGALDETGQASLIARLTGGLYRKPGGGSGGRSVTITSRSIGGSSFATSFASGNKVAASTSAGDDQKSASNQSDLVEDIVDGVGDILDKALD